MAARAGWPSARSARPASRVDEGRTPPVRARASACGPTIVSDDIDDRIIELQTRIAFQEDTLTQLNDALVSQQNQLFLLQAQVRELHDELRARTEALETTPRNPRDEIPPHY